MLLLDLMMPAGVRLRPAGGDPRRPGAALHAGDRADRGDRCRSKLRALQLGATDFLAKPVDASELVLRVRNTLAFRRTTTA